MKRTYATLVFAALVFSLAFAQPASADCVLPPANDCWITQEPETQSTLPAIPANFFGPGSDPIAAGTVVKLIGDPLPPATVSSLCPSARRVELVFPDCHVPNLDPVTCHLVAQRVEVIDPVDTIVRRTQTMDFGDGISGPKTTQMQVIAISLKNPPAFPLVVPFNGGASTQDWNVSLVHDPGQVQNPGSSTFTPTDRNADAVSGNVLVSTLPIIYKVTFTRGAETREVLNQNLEFNDTAGTFVIPLHFTETNVPTMSTWGLVLLVALLLGSSVMLLRRYRRTPGATA